MYRPVMLTRLGLVLLSLTQIKDASGPEEQKCGWLVFSVHGSFQRLPSNTHPPLFLPSHPTPSGRVSSTSKHFTTNCQFSQRRSSPVFLLKSCTPRDASVCYTYNHYLHTTLSSHHFPAATFRLAVTYHRSAAMAKQPSKP